MAQNCKNLFKIDTAYQIESKIGFFANTSQWIIRIGWLAQIFWDLIRFQTLELEAIRAGDEKKLLP